MPRSEQPPEVRPASAGTINTSRLVSGKTTWAMFQAEEAASAVALWQESPGFHEAGSGLERPWSWRGLPARPCYRAAASLSQTKFSEHAQGPGFHPQHRIK